MGKYVNNTSRLCVAPMPEADVFTKEHFAEGFPRAKDTADDAKYTHYCPNCGAIMDGNANG